MNEETLTNYRTLMSHWDDAMREYLCAEAIFDQIDGCSLQVCQHIMRAWQKLAILQILETGATPEKGPYLFERVTATLPDEIFQRIRKKSRVHWEENARMLFKIGAAGCSDLPQSSHALSDAKLRDQLFWTASVLRNFRTALARKYRMRFIDRLYRLRKPIIIAFALLIPTVYIAASLLFGSFRPKEWGVETYNDLRIIKAQQSWAVLKLGLSVDGRPLSISGRAFSNGLGTHANSSIEILLPRGRSTLSGACGVDDEVGQLGSIVCQIKDGEELLFQSQMLKGGSEPAHFSVPLNNRRRLSLIVTDGEDDINFDHADWVDLAAE